MSHHHREMQFYATLPSSACNDIFPSNNQGSFRVKLADRQQLDDNWECGLYSLHVPSSAFNTNESHYYHYRAERVRFRRAQAGETFTTIREESDEPMTLPPDIGPHILESSGVPSPTQPTETVEPRVIDEPPTEPGRQSAPQVAEPAPFHTVHIAPAYLSSIEQLLQRMHAGLDPQSQNRWRFYYTNGKVRLNIPSAASIVLSPALARILGFEQTAIEGGTTGTLNANIHNDRTTTMLIYSDVVEASYIGDDSAQVLNILSYSPLPLQTTVSYKFHPVAYHPLRQHDFESIGIEITDLSGRQLKFESGVVIATLHFRRRSYGL